MCSYGSPFLWSIEVGPVQLPQFVTHLSPDLGEDCLGDEGCDMYVFKKPPFKQIWNVFFIKFVDNGWCHGYRTAVVC